MTFDFSPHLAKIDVEVLTVVVFLLVSFASWLKDKIPRSRNNEKTDQSAGQEALRELVWRRQMGEENLSMPWETKEVEEPPLPARREVAPVREMTPPPVPVTHRPPRRSSPPTNPPPIPGPSVIQRALKTSRPEISAKEAELARSFEKISRAGHRRRARSKAVIKMLRRPESARQAILLREILGPPVSLHNDPEPGR